MSTDSAYPVFQHYGTNAQRLAFTPNPAAGTQPIYIWYESDTDTQWTYTTGWHQTSGAGGGVTASGTLTSGKVVIGGGGSIVSVASTSGILKGSSGTLSAAVDGTDYLSSATGWTKLAQVVTSSSATAVDFSGISSAYSSLKVLIYAQDTGGGTSDAEILLKINNDGTSGNYTACQRNGASNGAAFSNTTAATTDGSQAGIASNSGTTGAAANTEVTITGYASTAFHKVIVFTAGENTTTGAGAVMSGVFRWKSTAAINQLTFKNGGTAFTDGSIFTLYGLP